MKSFKLIVLLVGVGVGLGLGTSTNAGVSYVNNYSNRSSSLNDYVCDVDNVHYYENNYAIVNYKQRKNVYEKFLLNALNCNAINTIIDLLFVFFIMCSSFACSVVFVSNYVYSSMVNQFVTNYNVNKDMYEYDPYLFEYLDEFNNMKSCVLSVDFLNSLKYKFLKHATPKGEIIMNYNHLCCSFDYYCKKSNIIEFSYLDVVSRIYVVKNNCKNIYIDKCDNCDYGLVNDAEEVLEEDVDKEDVNKEDVNKEDVDKEDVDKEDANKEDVDKEDVIKKKESSIFYNKSNKKVKSHESTDYFSNKYKYRGTIEEFYSYCESNKYKIHYSDLLEASDGDCSIIFSIDKKEEEEEEKELMAETNENSASNKHNIGFKEFKKFQRF